MWVRCRVYCFPAIRYVISVPTNLSYLVLFFKTRLCADLSMPHLRLHWWFFIPQVLAIFSMKWDSCTRSSLTLCLPCTFPRTHMIFGFTEWRYRFKKGLHLGISDQEPLTYTGPTSTFASLVEAVLIAAAYSTLFQWPGGKLGSSQRSYCPWWNSLTYSFATPALWRTHYIFFFISGFLLRI